MTLSLLTLDPKGRLHLPTAARDLLGDAPLLTCGDAGWLMVVPAPWAAPAELVRWRTPFVGTRITLPAFARDWSGLRPGSEVAAWVGTDRVLLCAANLARAEVAARLAAQFRRVERRR